MMPTTNLTSFERQTKTFKDFVCSPSLAGGLQQQSIYFTAVHILLSPMAFLGNFLILAALHKISSLHRPSKLLYRCLATTDLLVSIVRQPFIATYWMSLAHEEWYLCRFAYKATYITAYALCVFVDNGGHKREQTSRPVVGAKIQTNCNFESHLLHGSNLLGLFLVSLVYATF